MAVAQSFRSSHDHHHTSSSPSSKFRLHLQTIFPLHHRSHQTRSVSAASSVASQAPSTTTSPSLRSSPSSTFSSFRSRSQSRVRAPTNDLDSAVLSPGTVSSLSPMTMMQPVSPFPSYGSNNTVRRQPSAIDLALLQEERYADEFETIGLGLLEPRPRANTGSSTASSQQSQQSCSMLDFLGETAPTSVVLDSIFDVMERA